MLINNVQHTCVQGQIMEYQFGCSRTSVHDADHSLQAILGAMLPKCNAMGGPIHACSALHESMKLLGYAKDKELSERSVDVEMCTLQLICCILQVS